MMGPDKIRKIIRKEFNNDKRIFNMQVFFNIETVIKIVQFFLKSKP